MGERDRGAIVQGLERLLSRGVDPSRDGDLLARFRAEGDQAAFEALVMRHGPMVRGVCRRLLRDDHDADDAFQATFLVLARKGAGLRDPDRLGPWLYGVASRVAAKARVRSARHQARPLTDDLPAREDARAEWSDVLPILDAELARLPSAQRDVLVACLLQGSSEQEAARAFACPVGTIKSRLSRAKEALRSRLVRRGIAPATALAAASSPGATASPVSAPLLRATLSLVAAPAAIPRSVAALTSGVAPTMLSKILAPAAAVVGGLAVVGLSAVAWTADPPLIQKATQPASTPIAKVSPEDRARLDRNLRTILLALHNSMAAEGGFPRPAVLAPDGRPLLSWRVAILPYLDEKELYDQFHLDEPWDGPHNRGLIARMPAVFQTPGLPAPAGETRIRGGDAPGTIFGSRADTSAVGKIAFEDVTDGTSVTAALVVAQEAVAWTRPGEMAKLQREVGWIKDGKATTYIEDYWPLMDDGPDGYVLGMVDGSVRRLHPSLQRSLLPALLSYAGGEPVNLSALAAPSIADAPVSTTESRKPADVEGRLRRVEEKLDEILDRLDALAPSKP
ncbi:MAG: hypothetical protein BGO49_26955 [Planctomycetales bacterium 71-10]|nr:MAG: hypothetical protein BGO49_26955 [Planctomycetales bacterium 71-10]